MSSLVYNIHPNGIVYVYENISYWDKDEKKTRHQRKLIGHKDPETGEIVPNRKKGDALRKRAQSERTDGCTDMSCGVSMMLDHCAKELQLTETLRAVFPHDWQAILTCAYSLLCNGKALSYVEVWTADNVTPYHGLLTSQDVTKLLDRIDGGRQLDFFRAWSKARVFDQYYAIDVTSVSSYSKARELVAYGHNRDKEKHLPQSNLLMVTGMNSGIPIYFRILKGNIPDVRTLRETVDAFTLLEMKRIHFCMDRGFFSEPNIDAFYKTHSHFLIGVPFSSDLAASAVEKNRETIRNVRNLCLIGDDQYYAVSELKKWKGHRFYLHTFFNSMEADEDIREFHAALRRLFDDLSSGKIDWDQTGNYQNYFQVRDTPKRGRKVTYNDQAIRDYEQNRAGWFVLGSNDVKSAQQALTIYRTRDRIEKEFDDMKNALDMKRLRVHTDDRARARTFIQYIAVILQTQLRSILEKGGWLPGKTFTEAIRSMTGIRQIQVPGRRQTLYTTLSKDQRKLIKILGIDFPTCV